MSTSNIVYIDRVMFFAISSITPLRAMVNQRLSQMLRCDQNTKTILELHRILCDLNRLHHHFGYANISEAVACLHELETRGFACAARVLKGADSEIIDKETFTRAAGEKFNSIKQTFAMECDLAQRRALANQQNNN